MMKLNPTSANINNNSFIKTQIQTQAESPFFLQREKKKTRTQKLEYIDQNSPSILLWFWFWFFKMCYGQHQACSRDSLTSSTNPMRDQLIIERAQNPQHQRSFVLRFCKQNLNPNQKPLRISVWRESDRMKS